MAVAEELRRAGRIREAVEILEKGARENPGYVGAHVALGRAYQQFELFPRAILAYQEALKIDRENLVAVRQLAECYTHQGDKVEALKKLKLFRGLKPGEKDVEEQIQRLEAELAATRRGGTGAFSAPAAHPTRTGGIPPLPPRISPVLPPRETAPVPTFVPPPLPPSPPAVEPPPTAPPVPDFDAALANPSFESFLEAPVVEPPIAMSPPPVPPPLPEAPESPAPAELSQEPPPALLFWEEELPGAAPVLSAEAVQEEASVPAEQEPGVTSTGWDDERGTLPGEFAGEPTVSESAAEGVPHVTETLAELYRSQGHLQDAASAYESLAVKARDEGAAESLRQKAAALSAEADATPAGRLRAFAGLFPAAPTTRFEDLVSVLEGLRTRIPGVKSAVLTDLEGLPLVTAGDAGGLASEALVAELTAFWNGVQRTEKDVGSGELRVVSLRGEDGGALVTSVSPEYSLILYVERDVPLGRIRYEAARAAGLLRPALG
jgi:predicted regulator of Ras-like GTPase activity (Roadblock/LC7/MglB family)